MFDVLVLPNIGFIGRPNTPYALVLHDLAFLIEPRWFRLKARWWHKAVYAKRLIREATWLFTVSERSKQDAIKLLGVPAERITVIPLGLSTSSCELQATSYKLPPMSSPSAPLIREKISVVRSKPFVCCGRIRASLTSPSSAPDLTFQASGFNPLAS